MSKTWRRSPVGAPKEPRPPEKGGKHNIEKEFLEEIFDSEENPFFPELEDNDL